MFNMREVSYKTTV